MVVGSKAFWYLYKLVLYLPFEQTFYILISLKKRIELQNINLILKSFLKTFTEPPKLDDTNDVEPTEKEATVAIRPVSRNGQASCHICFLEFAKKSLRRHELRVHRYRHI